MKKFINGTPVEARGIPLREGKGKSKQEAGAETLIVILELFFSMLKWQQEGNEESNLRLLKCSG